MSIANYVHEFEAPLPMGVEVVPARTPEEERRLLEAA